MTIRTLVAVLAAASLFTVPVVSLAFTDKDARTTGFRIGTFDDQFRGVQSDGGLVDAIINIVNALLVLAAIAAVVFVILGGVRYVTAQGDEDAVAQAKNTVIYAVIGIIVIILAAVIVNFFVSQVRDTGPGIIPPARFEPPTTIGR